MNREVVEYINFIIFLHDAFWFLIFIIFLYTQTTLVAIKDKS